MNNYRIVIRQKDRTLLKGKSINFNINRSFFKMRLLSGEQTIVHIEDLKAIFIVKDYTGNKDYTYSYEDDLLWYIIKIRITFHDSEVMIGFVPSYINGNQGFFVAPADLKGNNKSVYVVKSSIKEIKYV